MNIFKLLVMLALLANLISKGEVHFVSTALSISAIALAIVVLGVWFLLSRDSRENFIKECSERPRSTDSLINMEMLVIAGLFFFNELYVACVAVNLLWAWENYLHISVKKYLTSK